MRRRGKTEAPDNTTEPLRVDQIPYWRKQNTNDPVQPEIILSLQIEPEGPIGTGNEERLQLQTTQPNQS